MDIDRLREGICSAAESGRLVFRLLEMNVATDRSKVYNWSIFAYVPALRNCDTIIRQVFLVLKGCGSLEASVR